MITKVLSAFLLFVVLWGIASAQSVEQYEKAQIAIIAGIQDTPLKSFIKNFSSALIDYDWRSSRRFFDEEHYSGQMNMYLNDDFMFGHLGKVGKRDTAKVHQFYMRETLGLSQDEEEKRILSPGITNLFELEDFTSIAQVYFIKKETIHIEGADFSYIDFTVVVIAEDGRTYMGKCWVDPEKVKVFSSVG